METKRPRTRPRSPLNAYLEQPVTLLKGIGPAREEALREVGIHTFRDLVLLLPRRYRERPAAGRVADLTPGGTGAARGLVRKAAVSGRGRRRNLKVLVVEEDGGDSPAAVELFLFGRAFLKGSFRPGRRVFFHGPVTDERQRLQVLSPDFHLEGDSGPGFPGIVPVYSLPGGIFPRMFHNWVARILTGLPESADWREAAALPGRKAMSYPSLIPLAEALRNCHWPASLDDAERARRRLAYEEFFALQLGLARERAKRTARRAVRTPLPPELDEVYGRSLPFTLTSAQERAVGEIGRDLESGSPMHRLLQGDVGSGKTAVAFYALMAAALSGGQGALMAPTEVLAEQHAGVLGPLLEGAGIGTFCLRAGLKAAEIRERLDDPATGVIVGTHSLIQSRVRFRDLRVCVIDEQHKFGVRQRWNLKVKGASPHVLIMTATPIPRTLSLTLYGELDVSVLDTLPPGRRPIATMTAASLDDPELRGWMEADLAAGGRVFVVCPLVNESEHLDLEAAIAVHKRLEKDFGDRWGVGLLHGRLDLERKREALEAFRTGRLPLLATTVVVEVGVDVPEASTVVIMDAWRFGLSQLHQIRGRVGRGSRESRCYLAGKPATDAGRRRLEIILEESDGFRIAEEDLKMRGPGEAAGTRQHGLPPLRAGDYVADVDLMVAAREDAQACVDSGGAALEPLFDAGREYKLLIG